MRYKVLVTKPLPEKGLGELREHCDVIIPAGGQAFTGAEVLAQAPGLDAIIPVRTKLTSEFFAQAAQLKIVSNYGAGYDNIDVQAATAHGIPVTNLPDAVTESTAELAFTLLLTLSRRIIEADHYVRHENDGNWHPFLLISHEVYAKKLGIVGLGRIGRAVARRAQAFGMEVFFYDPYITVNPDPALQAAYLPLSELLQQMDYITLHVPHLLETHHMIGAQELAMMKPEAYLINAARGAIVDEGALVEALEKGVIAGAGLDVYEREPNVPAELLRLKNVVLTPHLGTTTIESKTRMAKEASENVLRFMRGERLANIVNRKELGLA